MAKNVYSVAQVNRYIKNMFTQDFMLARIYVKGEVSNCKYHTSGHIYFSLKDESGAIACVMFAGDRVKGLHFRMQEVRKSSYWVQSASMSGTEDISYMRKKLYPTEKAIFTFVMRD